MSQHADTVNVLIAEDDPDDRYLFESALLDAGVPAKISFVNTGQQLIERLVRSALSESPPVNIPDLIIADLKKPFFWFDVIRELRIYSQFRKIPLYVFSISSDVTIRNTAMREGATAFFQKPYNFPDLKKILREIVASQKR